MIIALWICIAALALICAFNFWALGHIGNALRDSLMREYGRLKQEADEEIVQRQQQLSMAAKVRRAFLREADQAPKN